MIPTPFWTYVYYHGEKWTQYGDDKVRWMFAHRSFLDAGIPVPGASDYSPGPFEPLMAIQSMVTRKDYKGREWGPNQKVTVDEALTIAHDQRRVCIVEKSSRRARSPPGKLADFVFLEKDPHDGRSGSDHEHQGQPHGRRREDHVPEGEFLRYVVSGFSRTWTHHRQLGGSMFSHRRAKSRAASSHRMPSITAGPTAPPPIA